MFGNFAYLVSKKSIRGLTDQHSFSVHNMLEAYKCQVLEMRDEKMLFSTTLAEKLTGYLPQ
jgi:predicted metal-dependent hydrolase